MAEDTLGAGATGRGRDRRRTVPYNPPGVADRDESSGETALRAELERMRAALQAAEARAEHAERLATVGRLLAGVVHELNNPLTAVTMYADSLASSSRSSAEHEKAVAILEAAERIRGLARELIGYVRPAAAGATRLDLGEVVDEALRLCRPDVKASAATVEREPGSAVVLGSRQSLVQVAVALISNAAHATPAGQRIRIEIAEANGEARLTVTDEGAGMPDEIKARAFDAFFTTRSGEALGLGLSTARAIVERHGGRITLESAPGRGTTATVVLPAA